MKESLKVKITLRDNDLTEREKRILHTLNMYLLGLHYSRLAQAGMAMNFLDKKEYDLTHYDLIFEQPLDEEQLETYISRIQTIIPNAYKMSDINVDKLEVAME